MPQTQLKNSLITKLGLTEAQVHQIVYEWYTNGMESDIFQNEVGQDLEEVLDLRLFHDVINKYNG